MELDTPNEEGVSLRATLEKVKRDTFGQMVDDRLLNELHPEPEDEILFDIFLEMYSSDTSFYVALDAYSRVWNISFTGEEISLLFLLWRETDNFNAKKIRAKHKKTKNTDAGKAPKGKPPRRGPRSRR